MPPFIRGKSKFDNWLVHEVIQAGYRETVDATEAATVVHVKHGYKSADAQLQVCMCVCVCAGVCVGVPVCVCVCVHGCKFM